MTTRPRTPLDPHAILLTTTDLCAASGLGARVIARQFRAAGIRPVSAGARIPGRRGPILVWPATEIRAAMPDLWRVLTGGQ